MKKYIFIVIPVLILSGCRTIKENTDTSNAVEKAPIISTDNYKEYNRHNAYEAAYRYRNFKVDESIQNLPKNIQINRLKNPDEYIRQISEYIINNSKNDFEKVKKAHDLVCLLVKYDTDSFLKNTIPDQNWKDTLINGSAVCAGYANLFQKICDEINIQCETVHGYGRGASYSLFKEEIPAESNHAWNIVTVNNEPYLIDCTWNSSYIDGKISKQEYTTDWLFLKPEHFVYTHFPQNPNHQLLKKAITAHEFTNLPFFKPKYFELIEQSVPNIKKINNAEGTCILEYTLKDGYEIHFNIYNADSGKLHRQNSFTQFTGDRYKSYLTFPEKGRYLVRIFWRKTGENKGQECGEFGVISSKGNNAVYPQQYFSFGKHIQVISPIEMPLEKGKKYDFKIKIDNKKYAAIIYEKNFIDLNKDSDGIFCKEMIIPNSVDKISIGAADTETGIYEVILEYSVK